MASLTAVKCKTTTKRGRHGDGGGLYLYVGPSGNKSWVLRIVIDGRRRDIGLGAFPLVTLAKAREKALDMRRQVAEGRNPLLERNKPSIPTFREAAAKVHDVNLARWKSEKYGTNWLKALELYAFPTLGDLPVDRIDRLAIVAVLSPIWTTKPETARRVRQRIRTVFTWAMALGFLDTNPAGESVSGALPPMPRSKGHFRALPFVDVPGAVQMVDESQASIAAKLCLRFVVLTACRSGEARGATWQEIDWGQDLWVIPGQRMKTGEEHRVPLSEPAMATLRQAWELQDDSDFVFPSPMGKKGLSDMTMTKILRSTGLADRATVHGFRSSFRDWASECTSAPWAVMELSLAHTVGNDVERAYARSDLLDQRRELMDDWAEFLSL